MSSAEVFIICEGQTEQTFVREVLAPVLAVKGVFAQPSLIGKPGHKGGDVRFDRAKEDIRLFLNQRRDTYVSTMFDYFRLDSEWPGLKSICTRKGGGATLTSDEKATIIETATSQAIGKSFATYHASERFIPYIEMHEFEALLFSDANILADTIGVQRNRISGILEECGSPEEINDQPDTAPAKRLSSLCSDYKKISMGIPIAEAIGIPSMRKQCPHFDAWVSKLEALA